MFKTHASWHGTIIIKREGLILIIVSETIKLIWNCHLDTIPFLLWFAEKTKFLNIKFISSMEFSFLFYEVPKVNVLVICFQVLLFWQWWSGSLNTCMGWFVMLGTMAFWILLIQAKTLLSSVDHPSEFYQHVNMYLNFLNLCNQSPVLSKVKSIKKCSRSTRL